jgi:hypothetical protein
MATRSTTSKHQPAPPNYRLGQTGVYHNVGRSRSVTPGSSPSRNRSNMSTAPVPGNGGAQYTYVPRING